MLESEVMKPLFTFFRVPQMPKKHWFDYISYGMIKFMRIDIISKSRKVISNAHCLALTCEEITIDD